MIDLGSGTITTIDFQKKQYSVMTFDEMKQMMEQMSQKMQKNDKGEMKFKVSANATGKTKQVSGFDAKEMIMKMEMEGTDKESGQKGGMTVTTDMWIASGIPGYQEVRDFYKRMAEKINWTPGGNMFAANPQVSGGMAEVYKEVAKLDGVPVQQLITMGASGQPGAAGASSDGSAAPRPSSPRNSSPRRNRPRSAARSAERWADGSDWAGRRLPRRTSRRLRPAGRHPADRRRAHPARCSR